MLYSQQTWYPLALAVYFLAYLPQGGIMVGYNPLMLSVTPNTVIGRIQAVIETVLFGASLISASVAGALGQLLPVSVIFLGSGLLVVLSGVLGWFTLPGKHRHQLPPGTSPAPADQTKRVG